MTLRTSFFVGLAAVLCGLVLVLVQLRQSHSVTKHYQDVWQENWGLPRTFSQTNVRATQQGQSDNSPPPEKLEQATLLEDESKAIPSQSLGDSFQNPEQTHESKPASHEPLNILLLYADDWTLKVLGALNPQVKTPNIDQIAQRGLLFTHNCVTTSVCWISRATLATGVYATIHKHLKPQSPSLMDDAVGVPWDETLYPLVHQHGYYTGLVGKWHAPMTRYMMQAFDYLKMYYGQHWMERDGQVRHVTDCNNEDALDFLQNRPRDKKFMLTVSFYATHALDYKYPPYQPQNTSMAWYQNDSITRPVSATEEDWKRLPSFLSNQNEARKRCINRFENATSYQRHIKDLYRMATEVDEVVGNILQELDRQGVTNETLIIFTTDNGNLHGEHGLAEKWYPWEESIRVPLVIQDPRMPKEKHGQRNNDFTLSIDLAPTILKAANIPVPSFMQGRDMSELYRSPSSPAWRQDFFYEWNNGFANDSKDHSYRKSYLPAVFALVGKEYKYFYWPAWDTEQLFHVAEDPYEQWDLSNETTSMEKLKEMRERYLYLKEWVQSGKSV